MKIKDLMKNPNITVKPDTLLSQAVIMFSECNMDAIPVVDDKNVLVGILSERDLIHDESYVHVKTLLELLNNFHFYKKDSTPLKQNIAKIMNLKVSDMMNTFPIVLYPESAVEEATRLWSDPKNTSIPIVDPDTKVLKGIVDLSDVTRLYGISVKDSKRPVDKEVDSFVKQFEKEFVLVTNFRARTWLFTSLIFTFVGFVIAIMLMIRITIQ
jgi:CBS domain-containing protein